MKELEDVAIPPLPVFLVGADYNNTTPYTNEPLSAALSSDERCLAELSGLVTNLDMTICGKKVLHRSVVSARFGIGSGQAADIIHAAKTSDADCIVFDFDITPTQLRNWERESGMQIYDRPGIIILIFASRAQTKEAVLQVECAKLEYALPRLSHTYLSLSRQRGGSYGSKGAGESKLELDRREIQERIIEVKKEITQVRKVRAVQRRKRRKAPVPTAALVGYTNAGKSSVLNALTNSDVMTKDALFATLDPSTRRLTLKHGMQVLISDTVGFIKNLPHSLIDAFHATLEEACLADILIIVLDAADPEIMSQYHTTLSVLREIGADTKPVIIVLNKIDTIPHSDSGTLQSLSAVFKDALPVSAVTGDGLHKLCDKLQEMIPGTYATYDVPLRESGLISLLYKEGAVSTIDWQDEYVTVSAKIPPHLCAAFEPFIRPSKTTL